MLGMPAALMIEVLAEVGHAGMPAMLCAYVFFLRVCIAAIFAGALQLPHAQCAGLVMCTSPLGPRRAEAGTCDRML